jgi:hypothetical protein
LSGICLNWGDFVINRIPTESREDAPHDVGTLWTMQRLGHAARCALMDWAGNWELRVVVDGEAILTQRCARGGDTFALAEMWKRRMVAQGWQQVLPSSMRNKPQPRKSAGETVL